MKNPRYLAIKENVAGKFYFQVDDEIVEAYQTVRRPVKIILDK